MTLTPDQAQDRARTKSIRRQRGEEDGGGEVEPVSGHAELVLKPSLRDMRELGIRPGRNGPGV